MGKLALLIIMLLNICFLAEAYSEEVKLGHNLGKGLSCLSVGKQLGKGEGIKAAQKAQEGYDKVKNFRAVFVQESYLAALDIAESSSGQVTYSRPGLMRWDYSKPRKQIFITKDSALWFYQEQEQQLTIDNFDQAFSSQLRVSFLLGAGKILDNFNVLESCLVEGTTLLILKPKNEQKASLEQLVLGFSSKFEVPTVAEVIDVAGNRTRISLFDTDANLKIDQKLFDFIAPPGTDIIDNR